MTIFICLVRSRFSLLMILLGLLMGCASKPAEIPGHLTPIQASAHQQQSTNEERDADPHPQLQSKKLPPLRVTSWSSESDTRWKRLQLSSEEVDLNVESMPLNEFIQLALGDVLSLSFIVDPAVQSRTEPVTLRISRPISDRQLLETVEQVLSGFEVGLSMQGDMLEVLPASKLAGVSPTFVGTKAKLAASRGKIMTIIPLKYSDPGEAMRFARFFITMGAQSSVDTLRRLNALLVIGDAAKVSRFRSVVEMIDQPAMGGRTLQVFRPIYLQSKELVESLKEAMKTQGVLIAETAEAPGVYIAEFEPLNSLLVAAPDDAILQWVEEWIEALDTPDVAGDALRSFVYNVQHSTAEELGSVIAEVLGGFASGGRRERGGSDASTGSSSEQAASANFESADGTGLRMVVDEPHNALIFVGSAQSYQTVYQLLQRVDVPAKQVLLEVTVADVTLENSSRLGVEWRFEDESSGGTVDGVGTTLGGLGVGGGGFTYTSFDDVGNVRARLNALATRGDARILSSPKLLAVDNEEARIQVGTQIAVVSSENTSDSVDGIIRSFNYVDTGVILSFTPTVMSGDQVRLNLTQEVSVPGASLNNTPPINTRTVQTTLIAQSGSTIMIGGLISSTDTQSDEQVPVLGDIPIFGSLFRGREVIDNSTEMIVLITPHIIESSEQIEALTEAFRSKVNWQ